MWRHKGARALFISSLLFGFLALGWIPIALPYLTSLSSDFSYSAGIRSFDNFYDEGKEDFLGPQESITTFDYQVVGFDESTGAREIANTFAVETKEGEPVVSITRIYGIDPRTGQHVLESGDRERTGFLFGPRMKGLFPQVVDKGSFTYWHVNYNTPARMHFREEESLSGTPVYRYEAVLHSDQTNELAHLPDVGTTRGVSLDTKLTLWIEPYTGHLVNYADSTEAFFYDIETGTRIYPWNSFKNTFTASSVSAHAREALSERHKVFVLSIVVPIVFTTLAILAFIFALLLYRFHTLSDTQKIIVQRFVVPGIVLVLFLGISVSAWQATRSLLESQMRAEFESASLDVVRAIESRIDIYINALYSARGFWEASTFVSRDEWRIFIDELDLDANYPGIQGMGLVEVIEPEALEAHIARVRSEGFPEYRVHPEGERDIYTSIIYLEPFDERNRQAFGFDMFYEPTRRAAMTAARDRDTAVISGAVTLVQEIDSDIQAGFLLYIPLYEKGVATDTLEERRRAHDGYVYSVFRFGNFMNEVYEAETSQMHLEVFDGHGISALHPERRMYNSHGTLTDPVSDVSEGAFTTQVVMQRGEHLWTLRFTTLDGFGLNPIREWIPFVVLLIGLLVSVVVTMFAYTLATGRFRAVELAQSMTSELRESQDAMLNILEELKRQVSDTQRFKQAVDSATDAIMMTTPDKKIVYVNKAWEQLTGWKSEEVIGTTPHILQSGDTPDDVYTQLNEALARGEAFMTEDLINKRKDGTTYDASLSVYPVVSEASNDILFYVAVEQDITTRKEIDRAKTQFVSLASHQLRTPLSAIRWYAEILAESKNLTDDEQEYTAEIYHGTKRMIQLVNALLNVSRLELGTLVVVPEEVDITDEARQAVHDIQPVAKKRKVHVHLEDSPKHVTWSDTKLLRIILDNLITNATKYTLAGGDVSIRVESTKSGDTFGGEVLEHNGVGIRVKDTGVGIPIAQQEKIFEKLFRADNVRQIDTDGSGLGLYIVKLMAQRLGGDVWFESEENKGTTFFVYLPDKKEEDFIEDSTIAEV